MKKIFILFSVCLIPLLLNPIYAENSLQNSSLKAQSAILDLNIEFGADKIEIIRDRFITTAQLDSIFLSIYGDEVTLSDPQLKVVSNGDAFRISSIPEGIIMYGYKNQDIENYRINVYIATDTGLLKFPVSSESHLPDEKVIETEPEPEKEQYIPDLMMTTSHDFRTYWKETFNIDVQAFDGRVNSDPKSSDFNGRIDGVDVKVLLSLDDIPVATLSGVTANNGHWDGEYFFKENISAPGEYTVDVILSYLGQTISKSSSMFVIASTTGGDSSNNAPIANAGNDQSVGTSVLVTLDGSGSSDPDGDSITYSWTQTSGTSVTLSDSTLESPTFTSPGAGTVIVFELTVTDSRGKTSTIDSVTITVS